jgi:hypothetical protein
MALTTDHDGLDLDYEKLRAKYSTPGFKEKLISDAAAENSAPAKLGGSPDAISQIRICQACNAMGYVTKTYGFRVLQEGCTACGGEGLIGTKQPSADSTSEHMLKQRITQLEAAIAAADSLEELETLESELRTLRPDGV